VLHSNYGKYFESKLWKTCHYCGLVQPDAAADSFAAAELGR